jgi:hypothetical protein
MASINLSDIKFGVLNPVGDSGIDDSFDRRRSTLVNYLQKVISDAYQIDTLKKIDVYQGIVVASYEKKRVLTSDPGSKLKEFSKVSIKEALESLVESSTITVYKVYIPELEPRPAPTSSDDPVLETYQDVLPDLNLFPGGLFGQKKFQVGQVVGVRYTDFENLSDPRIVSAGEVLDIKDFKKSSGGGNTRETHNNAVPRRSAPGSTDDNVHEPTTEAPRSSNRNLCTDAMAEYTPGTNAEELRTWIRSQSKIKEKIKNVGAWDDGPQLDNGGDITPELVTFIKKVLGEVIEEVPEISSIRITGGNDAYHQCRTKSSYHKTGNAFDFTINPPTAANLSAVNTVLLEYSAGTNGRVRFKNEYEPGQQGSTTTGDHFHVQLGGTGGSGGRKNFADAKQLLQAGRINNRALT